MSHHEIQAGTSLQAQIAIVGTGAAGIPLALQLADAGINVLLLEAGGEDLDERQQALYGGTVTDSHLHNPPDTYRQRRLGGSTAIWGGRCMPLDPQDFKRRSHIPNSGWPLSFEDLCPYYQRANRWLEAGEFDYEDSTALPDAPPQIPGFSSRRVRNSGLERFSRPTDVFQRYRDRLGVHPKIRLLAGASCVRVQLSSDAARVAHLEMACLDGTRFKVCADHYVLATGGIETPRLLLASRDVLPSGIGNRYDQVGRYYQCHIAGNVGVLELEGPPEKIRHGYEISREGIYCRRRFSLTEAEQNRMGLHNIVLRLHFPRITDPAHGSGVLSGLFFARSFISYEYATRLRDGASQGWRGVLQHLFNIVSTPLDTLRFLYLWITQRTLASRKFPSVILSNGTNRFSLEVHGEQIPNPESRITLIDECDELGVPKVNIDWRYLPEDVASVATTMQVLDEELRATGSGRLSFDPATFEEELMRFGAYGGHHIGATRMATDPRHGVVDADCKVHGVSNLHIASSSVFPTSGQANPTLTITALALRLGDHLADQLKGVGISAALPVDDTSRSEGELR